MQNRYLEELMGLLNKARPLLISKHNLEFKNVFGAVAGYANSNIFISCGKFGLALRLPAETLANLFIKKDVMPLKYFPKGHIKKEYAVLPKRILDNNKQFKILLDESIDYVNDK